MSHLLSEIRLSGIRGIEDLRVILDYPVSVIAGGNASGKSTVLFAAACAYKVEGAGPKDYVPSTLFPDYRPEQGTRRDGRREITLEYDYVTPSGRSSMRWGRKKGWSRSFFGRKGAKQPERAVYLRTLSNLSNPSEVRGVLRMSRLKTNAQEKPLTAAQIDFAQRMLPFSYKEVVKLSSPDNNPGRDKNLLFAVHGSGASYSELHMASGERTILRLSQEIAQLEGALVLIDEVEAGLHPWVQQLLMLHLQQLALRNDLQIIVTSHSPVVLDAVPSNARIFLERNERGNVEVCPPYRDIVQNALYGRSSQSLNLFCEDEAAESILHGVFDYLLPDQKIRLGSLHIGRDTGAQEFPTHAAAFRKFGQIENFVFILDGDQRGKDMERKILEQAGHQEVPVLFLPGNDAPEVWVWECLGRHRDSLAGHLNTDTGNLTDIMKKTDAIFDSASDTKAQIAKLKIENLGKSLNLDSATICRRVAQWEARRKDSDILPLVDRLKDILARWRMH